MSFGMSLEEKFEALMKSYEATSSSNQYLLQRLEEIEGENLFLSKQLEKSMKQKQRILESPTGSNLEELCEVKSQHSIYKEEELRKSVRAKRLPINISSNDFRVNILKFEGKLDPEGFLDWLSIVERVFEYKDVLEDEKVKLVALKPRKYASLWWLEPRESEIKKRKSEHGRR